jgi:hypothetical protein
MLKDSPRESWILRAWRKFFAAISTCFSIFTYIAVIYFTLNLVEKLVMYNPPEWTSAARYALFVAFFYLLNIANRRW